MNITEKAMLVRLSISQWTARKLDRKVTAEIIAVHKANADAGRFNKVLVDLAEIKALQQNVTAARIYHYSVTLPWTKGLDLLPSDLYFDYTKKMQEFKNKQEALVKRFLSIYEALKAKARKELNGMFNEEDYPAVSILATKFSFDIDIEPIPQAGDFRVNMSKDEAESIRKDIEARVNQRVSEAVKDAFNRLYTAAKKIADICKVEDKKFHDTMIENLRELLAVLPSLNITNDAALTKACKEAAKLAEVDPDALRDDPQTRSETAKKADALTKKLRGFSF